VSVRDIETRSQTPREPDVFVSTNSARHTEEPQPLTSRPTYLVR